MNKSAHVFPWNLLSPTAIEGAIYEKRSPVSLCDPRSFNLPLLFRIVRFATALGSTQRMHRSFVFPTLFDETCGRFCSRGIIFLGLFRAEGGQGKTLGLRGGWGKRQPWRKIESNYVKGRERRFHFSLDWLGGLNRGKLRASSFDRISFRFPMRDVRCLLRGWRHANSIPVWAVIVRDLYDTVQSSFSSLPD